MRHIFDRPLYIHITTLPPTGGVIRSGPDSLGYWYEPPREATLYVTDTDRFKMTPMSRGYVWEDHDARGCITCGDK